MQLELDSSLEKTSRDCSPPRTTPSAISWEHLSVRMVRFDAQVDSGRGPVQVFVPAPVAARRGESSTPSFSESPNVAVACSLSSVLEDQAAILRRYFLSPRACAGILRRAARRGKKLPEPLEAALKAVAGPTTRTG